MSHYMKVYLFIIQLYIEFFHRHAEEKVFKRFIRNENNYFDRVDILAELSFCQPVLLTRNLYVDEELIYFWLYWGVGNMKWIIYFLIVSVS